MKKLLIIFSVLFALLLREECHGQGTVKYTAGISYGYGDPTYTPNGNVSKKYVNLTTLRSSTYSGTAWVLDGRGIDVVSGCAAPAYTPGLGQSNIALNNCTLLQNGQGPELYVHNGTSWIFINEKNTAPTYTAGTGIDIIGTEITNTAPDQVVSITGAGINAVTGTYPNFTVTGTEEDGSVTNELQTLSVAGSNLSISGGNTVTLPTPSSTLDALTDVTITSPTNAQILQYNTAGSQWVNATLSAITGSGTIYQVPYFSGTSALLGSQILYSPQGVASANYPVFSFGSSAIQSVAGKFDFVGANIRVGCDIGSAVNFRETGARTANTNKVMGIKMPNKALTGETSLFLGYDDGASFGGPVMAFGGSASLIGANMGASPASMMFTTSGAVDYADALLRAGKFRIGGITSSIAINGTIPARVYFVGFDNLYSSIIMKVTGATDNNAFAVLGDGSIGVGTSAPVSGAKMEVKSTTGIMVPPNMSSTQRDAIATPPNGIIFNTTTGKFQGYAAGTWVDLH